MQKRLSTAGAALLPQQPIPLACSCEHPMSISKDGVFHEPYLLQMRPSHAVALGITFPVYELQGYSQPFPTIAGTHRTLKSPR